MSAINLNPSIDTIRRNLEAIKQPGEPDWVTKMRDILKPKLEIRPISQPVAGPREYESWLAAILRSLSEARVASTEWISLISAQDSIWLQLNDAQAQLQSLTGEEIPSRIFAQSQLDLQILLSENNAISRDNHANRIRAIIQSNQDAFEKTLIAHGVLALAQFNRDTAPAPAENFAKGTDERFKGFAQDGNVLQGSIEATKYLAKQGLDIGTSRDSDEASSSTEQAALLREAQLAIRQNIENLSAERRSLEKRKQLVTDRLEMLTERLNGKKLDFERRMSSVVERYRAAVHSLAERVDGFTQSLELVFGGLAPTSKLKKLTDLATFDDEDRGAQLDLIEIQIKEIEEWCSFVTSKTFRTVRSKNCLLSKLPDGVFEGTCSFESQNLPQNSDLVRIKGIRLFALGQTTVFPGHQSVTRVTATGEAELSAEQDAWLTSQPGPHDFFWGTKEFWNAGVGSSWKIRVIPALEFGGNEIECLFEILFDYATPATFAADLLH